MDIVLRGFLVPISRLRMRDLVSIVVDTEQILDEVGICDGICEIRIHEDIRYETLEFGTGGVEPQPIVENAP